MRYVYLGLVTFLATSICVDSVQAASGAAGRMPTKADEVFLGFVMPGAAAAPQETPQGAGTKRGRGNHFDSSLHRDPSPATVQVPAHRARLFDGASDSDEDIVSASTSVSAASDLGSLSRAFERLSAFSRSGSRPVGSSRTTDPRLLGIGLDDGELPEDLAGHLIDARLLNPKDPDDEAFEIETVEEPLTVAHIAARLQELVAEAVAKRVPKKQNNQIDKASRERKRL